MTLAELRTLDVSALWTGLTVEQQAEIGVATLAVQFAELVAQDDGSQTSRDDRLAALVTASDAYDDISSVVEQAFPEIEWWSA